MHRNEAAFDHQMDNQLNKVQLLDLAMQELSGKAMHFYGNIEDKEDIEEEQNIEQRKIKEGKPIRGGGGDLHNAPKSHNQWLRSYWA